jgi:large subunit ribosomal protein L18e
MGKTNPLLVQLINKLTDGSWKNNTRIWKDIAKRLSKSRKNWSKVNVGKISKYCESDDTIIVPGILLGMGHIDKPVTIAAFKVSSEARRKIEYAGGRCISIDELVIQNPKGSNIKIIG